MYLYTFANPGQRQLLSYSVLLELPQSSIWHTAVPPFTTGLSETGLFVTEPKRLNLVFLQ